MSSQAAIGEDAQARSQIRSGSDIAEAAAEVGTLGQRIHADLEAKILSGEWPPGHRLPYEHELMAQYGCARMTVNRAMTALASAGLIERRRRAGSFVAKPRMHSAILQIPDLAAEIRSRGATYSYELISRKRRKAAKRDTDRTAFALGTPLIELSCRHLADANPLVYEERLISVEMVPEAEHVSFETVPPGSWMLEHVPWTEAEHRISALNADESQAEALSIQPGEACLCVERRTWRSGKAVTFVRQIFVGTRYDLVARFSPR